MKLNSFFTKSAIQPRSPAVFHLGNESREKGLEQQISSLQKEISFLKDTTIENQNLTSKVQKLQVEAKKGQIKYNTLHAEMQQREITIDNLMAIESKYLETFQALKTTTNSFEQLQIGFEAMKAKDTEHQIELTHFCPVF